MKRFRLLILLILILIPTLLVSCTRSEELKAPFGAEVEMTSLTLKWHGVRGARLYTIKITPEGEPSYEVVYSKTSYPLESLKPGKYELRVKANGKDGESLDSDWSTAVEFEREAECGMEFTLNPDGKSYTVSGKGTVTADVVIPDTYRTYPVTAVGYKAFFNKSDITSITFGSHVTSIGDFAFGNCSYITSLTLPQGLTHIGESAFASCRLLDGEIIIPGGVKVISKSAFAYCMNIDAFYLEEGVKRIEKTAFSSCTEIKSISLPDSIEYVGEHAFAMCENISSVDLGEGVKVLDSYSLSALPTLKSVKIPDSVTVIGEGAFYNCSALAAVEVGDNIEEIGKGAFQSTALFAPVESGENEVYVGTWLIGLRDCSATSFTLRENTTAIASYTFYGNKSIVKVNIPDSVVRIGKAAFSGSHITSAVLGEGVKHLGDEAFLGCGYLSTVILGSYNADEGTIRRSSLISIGNSAFKNCIGIMKIEMPSSLKSVGSNAFLYSGLHFTASSGVVYAGGWAVGYNGNVSDTVFIKEDTVGIADYAFYACKPLREISIPMSVRTIGTGAFYNCESLIRVELPSTLEVIEDYTFYCCQSLEIPALPLYLRSIGRSAFYQCGTNIEAKFRDTENDVLIIPSTVTSIGDYAFYGCGYRENASISEQINYTYYGIDEIVFGDGVKSIGDYAFRDFSSIKRIDLGNVEYIGGYAFYGCESLAEVDFGDSLIEIGQKAFYKCENLIRVNAPDTLVKIGARAFYKCTSLESCALGGVEYIGDYAFYGNTALTAVYLSDSTKSIGKQAFRNCCELASITLGDKVEYVGAHAFYADRNLTVYISHQAVTDKWDNRWNSSYRPTVLKCEIAKAGGHVISIQKTDIENLNQYSTLSAPAREGYNFIGWDTDANATEPTYTHESLYEADGGAVLYAIWVAE